MDKNDELLMTILKQNQSLVEQYINKNKRKNVNDDDNFEKISKKNISDRDDSYTELLKHFVNITRIRNKVKEIHKWIYFWIIMLLTILFGISIFILLSRISLSDENYISGLIVIISSLVSFTSVIISIPLIITKYLFSSKEDKRIADIILHTQKHDLNGKKIIRHLVGQELDKLKSTPTNSIDNELIELVNNTVRNATDALFTTSEENQEEQLKEQEG